MAGPQSIVAALHAPLLLVLWVVLFGQGAYVGASLEIAAIVHLPAHQLVAAVLPILGLSLAAWWSRRVPRFAALARLTALGALLGAAAAGPLFLIGLPALSGL